MLANRCVRGDPERKTLKPVLKDWMLAGKNAGRHLWLLQPSRGFVPDKVRAFERILLDACAGL